MQLFEGLILKYFPIIPIWVIDVVWFIIVAAALIAFFSLFAGPVSWLERRIAGRMMSRIGPNRVGPQGVIQWLADGFKCFLKEDLIPRDADSILFRFAPYPVFLGVSIIMVVLPFSGWIIGADINVGLLYIVGAWGLVVLGLLAAGWGSNNKWSLLGGMRSAAQMVSYEIPMVIALLSVVLLSGSMSLQDIIAAQGGWPQHWFVFASPFTALAFVVYFIAAVAEGNRTPFDIPEAESELVAGYNTEYSGMRFLFFLFAEWGNLYVVSAIAAALFLGGWKLPEEIQVWAAGVNWILPHILEIVVFQLKTWVWVLLIIQLRWTLPRLRVDQLMSVAWKYLLPMSFVALIGNALWMIIFPKGLLPVQIFMVGMGALIALYFVYRVVWQLVFTKSKPDVNWII